MADKPEPLSSNSVSVPREMLERCLNVLGNAVSIWPDATGAKDIDRLRFQLVALAGADETFDPLVQCRCGWKGFTSAVKSADNRCPKCTAPFVRMPENRDGAL